MMPTLREARTARLLSVRALAELAGVAFTTVHQIETGKRVPRLQAMRKISAALDVEPATIDEFAAAIAERSQPAKETGTRGEPGAGS